MPVYDDIYLSLSTELSKALRLETTSSKIYAAFYLALLTVSFALYFITSLMDPGYVREEDESCNLMYNFYNEENVSNITILKSPRTSIIRNLNLHQ